MAAAGHSPLAGGARPRRELMRHEELSVLHSALTLAGYGTAYSVASLVGSRCKRRSRQDADYDFVIMWERLFDPHDSDSNIAVDTQWLSSSRVDLIHFRREWALGFSEFFSKTGRLEGDWGLMSGEGFLALLQQASFLSGDAAVLRRIQQALTYPMSFRRHVLAQNFGRIINSLVAARRPRSRAMQIKTMADFLDSSLRIIYASEGRFYSTPKWFDQDIARAHVPSGVRAALLQVVKSPPERWFASGLVATMLLEEWHPKVARHADLSELRRLAES